MKPTLLLLVFSFVGLSTAATANAAEGPDIIFVNGDIYTQAAPARAQAMAVRDGRIVAVGSNDDIRKLKRSRTQVIDLGGHFVMSGFNDAHVHLEEAGLELLSVDLRGAHSLQEMQQRIAAAAKAAAAGEWLVGGGWDQTLWTDQKLPSRQDLDAVTGEHPAVFSRVDGHIAVANSAALKAGGVTAKTQAPEGGSIDHGANGEPTGILRETARRLVESKIPPPTPSRLRRAAELAIADAARWGITSAQDNSRWEAFLAYEDLEREGKLTLRISEWLNFDDSVDLLLKHRASHPASDPMLHTAMLKGFMDGSLGSRTAALLAPYSDDAGNSGLPRYEQGKLNRMAIERALAGFQIGFHAIGDRAVQMALDAFAEAERAAKENARVRDFRFRIEHDQVVTPAQFEQYRKLGVIASMQPNHLLTDMNWAMARIGPERAKTSYPWKEFLDNGVRIAFGTDYPVEPITPFRGIYAAVTRQNEAGTKSYLPEQKLTIQQALAAYTTGSAYAQFAEKEKGTLAPGMMADFVVLDRDLTKVSPPEILKTQVLRTVVGGNTVYQADAVSAQSPQGKPTVIVGVAPPLKSPGVPFNPDSERDQMVRTMNALQPKNATVQIKAVALQGIKVNEIFANAREQSCQLVVFTRVALPHYMAGQQPPMAGRLPDHPEDSQDETQSLHVDYDIVQLSKSKQVSKGTSLTPSDGSMIRSAFLEVAARVVADIQRQRPLAVP